MFLFTKELSKQRVGCCPSCLGSGKHTGILVTMATPGIVLSSHCSVGSCSIFSTGLFIAPGVGFLHAS